MLSKALSKTTFCNFSNCSWRKDRSAAREAAAPTPASTGTSPGCRLGSSPSFALGKRAVWSAVPCVTRFFLWAVLVFIPTVIFNGDVFWNAHPFQSGNWRANTLKTSLVLFPLCPLILPVSNLPKWFSWFVLVSIVHPYLFGGFFVFFFYLNMMNGMGFFFPTVSWNSCNWTWILAFMQIISEVISYSLFPFCGILSTSFWLTLRTANFWILSQSCIVSDPPNPSFLCSLC